MYRRSVCAALVAAGVLAAPAGALADSSLVAGPIKVKGYDLTLTASDGATDSLAVMAMKTSGKSRQLHMWTLQGANVKIGAKKATIKGKLGQYGSINAKVRTNRSARGRVPAGCTGNPGTVRTGKLTGKTKLVLDSTYFRTVAPKSMKAMIAKAGKLDCTGAAGGGGGNGQPSNGLLLTASGETSVGQLMLNFSRVGDKVSQQAMVTEQGGVALHMITAETGPAGLTAASDMSSATAQGAGGFLTGTLSFAGESMGTMSSGEISGDLAAKFDSIGTQSLPAGTSAILMNR